MSNYKKLYEAEKKVCHSLQLENDKLREQAHWFLLTDTEKFILKQYRDALEKGIACDIHVPGKRNSVPFNDERVQKSAFSDDFSVFDTLEDPPHWDETIAAFNKFVDEANADPDFEKKLFNEEVHNILNGMNNYKFNDMETMTPEMIDLAKRAADRVAGMEDDEDDHE